MTFPGWLSRKWHEADAFDSSNLPPPGWLAVFTCIRAQWNRCLIVYGRIQVGRDRRDPVRWQRRLEASRWYQADAEKRGDWLAALSMKEFRRDVLGDEDIITGRRNDDA